MANSPTDYNSEIMKEDHGTHVLITDQKADYYLALAKNREQESQWQDSKPG